MPRSASTIHTWNWYPEAMDRSTSLDTDLPGADLVSKGLDDLHRGVESSEALLVSIGRPRLLRLGLDVPSRFDHPEIRLYERLASEEAATAH
ncbi:MAG: hypothetical protein ACREL6_08260, partial [Gemmatimonadales bacterium]